MPKYEMDEVLTKIMRQFRRHGYSATSIRDLEEATGLFRGSLYHTFGDKREMFFRALRHYGRIHRADPIAELEKGDSPRGAVLAVFGAAASAAPGGGSRESCLEVNAALELGAHDEEVASLVAGAFAGMAEFFCASIERGQACGEISPEVDPKRTAKSLLGLFLGLRVLACVSPDESFLESVVGQAEALLPSPAGIRKSVLRQTRQRRNEGWGREFRPSAGPGHAPSIRGFAAAQAEAERSSPEPASIKRSGFRQRINGISPRPRSPHP